MPPLELGVEIDRLVQAVQRLMEAQLEDQRQLLIFIRRKHEAIRRAQMAAMTDACRAEEPIVRRLTELELQRQRVVVRLTELLRAGAVRPMTVAEIAQAVGEPEAGRLRALAQELRAAVVDTQRANSILSVAIQTLSRHLTGIVQAVQSALTRAQVYGRGGRLTPGVQVRYALDLKS